MAELTDEQILEAGRLIGSSLQSMRLRDELLDHCCCHIEDMMEKGVPFIEALNKSFELVAPDGFTEIEESIKRSIHTQNPQTMKTSLYFSGFLAAFCILLGITFRMFHWPFANMILLCGDLSLVLAMSILLTDLIRFPREYDRTTYYRTLAGAAGGLILAVGSSFKIMYWPTANMLMLIGMLLITFVFLPLFFWQLYKREMASS